MEKNLNEWADGLTKEINLIKVSFDSFFISRPIESYYRLTVDTEGKNLVIELIDERELPNEIVQRIMEAYKRSRPDV